MKKPNLMSSTSILKKSIALALALGITACSNSDNNDSNLTTVSGAVVDGYLSNAEVCLDTNNDKDCTTADKYASVRTNEQGEYSLPEMDPNDIAQYNIIAKIIPGETTDSDFSEQELDAATYSTPKGRSFISPLTSLIVFEIEESDVSVTDAETKVKTELNLVDVSLFENHVKRREEGDTKYIAVHEKAQTVAKSIAAANTAAKQQGISGQKSIHTFVQQELSGANLGVLSAMADFNAAPQKYHDELVHFSQVLESFDAAVEHQHQMMPLFHTALTGFADSYGCVMPEKWHEEMQHCMVMSHMDSKVNSVAQSCPEGQAWHAEMGHCMAMAAESTETVASNDEQSCPEGQAWHAGMGHCMVMTAESTETVASNDEQSCPEGQAWHAGMGHCMAMAVEIDSIVKTGDEAVDGAMEHTHSDAEELVAEAEAEVDEYGCVAPQKWHEAGNHCMVF